MNRHDWISAFNNELGWTIAVERLAGIEVPDRAQWIRTMFAEWNRILNHLMFAGSFPLELGAMTPIFYSFIEREMVQDLMESATGARMHHSYCRVGGLKDDLPRRVPQGGGRGCVAQVRKWVKNFETLIMGNEIIFARCRNVGVLPADVAVAYGTSGPVLQASGVPMDPRKDEPYEKYGEVEFEVPVGTDRRLLRPPVGAGRARDAVAQHHRAVHGEAARPASSARTSSRRRYARRRRGLRAHREPARADGLLRGGQRQASSPTA